MKIVFLYRGGNVPQEEMSENMQEWGMYIEELTKRGSLKSGLPFKGGKMVGKDEVKDYESSHNDVSGYSELEFDSMEDAIKAAQMAPSVKHGGWVEVREGMDM